MYKTAEITAQQLLQETLMANLPEAEWNWFTTNIIAKNGNELAHQFIPLFSLIPRFITAATPQFSPETVSGLEKLYPGFSQSGWNIQQLCRIVLMLKLPPDQNEAILKKLFETADIKELVILYKGLYFLENADDFVLRMQEGIRTNMTDVFEAIALHNPYAYLYLSEDAWNQLILKAVFTGRPLFKIYGLDQRANERLALILHGYIQERWSAGRTVSPEIWRGITGFVNDEIAADLNKMIETGTFLEQEAAIKALKGSCKSWNEIGAAFLIQTTQA